MSNENKKSMGDGQPSKKKIVKASWEEKCWICQQKTITKPMFTESDDAYEERTDGLTKPLEGRLKYRLHLYVCLGCFVSPDEEHEWDENSDFRNLRHRQRIWYAGDWDMPYPLQETIWDIEGLINYLNQIKNKGRLEMRTIKDKENQKLADFDIERYATLKESEKSTLLQLRKYQSEDAAHQLIKSLDKVRLEMVHLQIKYKSCTGREITGKEDEQTKPDGTKTGSVRIPKESRAGWRYRNVKTQ